MSQTSTVALETLAPASNSNPSAGTAKSDSYGLPSQGIQLGSELDQQVAVDGSREMSKSRASIIIATLTGTTVVSSFSTGLLTVCLPKMAPDLGLPPNLLLWPASVYALTSGCLLILAGSIADLVGSRKIFLLGCFLQGIFVLACGLSKTGIQLIMFRAMQGIAVSMCLPTAVSIVTNSFANGQRRNLGLAFMGFGQCLGFLIGLVLGGLFADTIGWRAGYYMCAAANGAFFAVSFFGIPRDRQGVPFSWSRLWKEIDWVGATMACACLGLLSYVLASITASVSNIRDASNIALLTISFLLVPTFVFWVGRQERLNKPALIPNSLWRNSAFSSICVMLMLSWAVINVMEWFFSLFFQDVQHLSALQTSLRFIPSIISGAILNIATGFLAHKFRADYLVVVTSFISALGPLLMALVNPAWPYWYSACWAMFLGPFSADVMFTVAALVITSVFPERTQALGGAVFQTLAQFGTSLGLAIMASISTSVTDSSEYEEKTSPEALMAGYRVTFWVCFAWMLLAIVIGGLGLRRVGKVGLKRE